VDLIERLLESEINPSLSADSIAFDVDAILINACM
jgi:hypothetical protein